MVVVESGVIVILAFLVFIVGLFTGIACTSHGKSNRQKVKSYNISNEQLNELVSKYYKDYSKVDFIEFVSDWLKGEVPPQDMRSNGGAMIVEPCKGRECPCFPTREDHCDCMGADGMCHHMINLNVICGIHECAERVINNVELLTDEEIEWLNDTVTCVLEERYCGNPDKTDNA